MGGSQTKQMIKGLEKYDSVFDIPVRTIENVQQDNLKE